MRTRWLLSLAFGLAVACAPADASIKTVEVTIEHSAFQPTHIEVEAGTRVLFVVRNDDPIAHEFLIGDRHMQRIHEKGTEAHHGARPGEISIPALEMRETTYLFEQPGSLIFGCHLPGHYAYGMRGTIDIVTEG